VFHTKIKNVDKGGQVMFGKVKKAFGTEWNSLKAFIVSDHLPFFP
jgi:hypothetical protein